jgi:hypothetical protein
VIGQPVDHGVAEPAKLLRREAQGLLGGHAGDNTEGRCHRGGDFYLLDEKLTDEPRDVLGGNRSRRENRVAPHAMEAIFTFEAMQSLVLGREPTGIAAIT